MFRLRIIAGACFVFAFPGVASADADQAVPAQLQEIGSVAVTSDRHREPATRSARPTYIVTAAQIQARGAHTIAEALTQTPGLQVLQYGGIGQQSNVLAAGSNEQNDLLILINGFPIQNAYAGSVDLGTISTAGVQRIEIVEGGAAALYGSSASVGVINIITGYQGRPYAAVSTGSFATNRIIGADSLHAGSGTVFGAFERETAGNSYPYQAASTYNSPSGFPSSSRINSAGQLTSGLLTYTGNTNAQWRINGIFDSYLEHNGVPNSLPTTDHSAYQAATTQLAGASVEHDGLRAKTTLTLSNTRNTLQFADLGGTFGATPVSSTNVDRTDLSLRSLIGQGRSRVLVGADAAQSAVAAGATSISLPPMPMFTSTFVGARQAQSAIYAQYEHDIATAGRFYAGLRYEHDSPQGRTLAPSVGAAVPIGNLRLAANASTAFRIPTLLELYYPNYGNPGLVPERSKNADITLSAPAVGGGISVRFFTRTASNLIQPNPNTFTAVNIAHASFQGLVFSAATKPYKHITFTSSFTDTYRADNNTAAVSTRLLYTPQDIVTFALEKQPNGNALTWGILGNIYSQSIQYGGVSQPWSRINAYFRVPISPGAIVTIRSYNVGNEAYEANAGYPMPGRSYEAELSTR